MKQIITNIYSFNELSKEAQEEAHKEYITNNDFAFLSDDLNERLHELLLENKIKDLNDTSKPGTKPTQVIYSLSYSQGDGCMFEGNFEWSGYSVNVKKSGHYSHYNSKDITITDEEGNEPETDEPLNAFDAIYCDICKQLERHGYDIIEYDNSMENFVQACEANDWTFTIDGTMKNA